MDSGEVAVAGEVAVEEVGEVEVVAVVVGVAVVTGEAVDEAVAVAGDEVVVVAAVAGEAVEEVADGVVCIPKCREHYEGHIGKKGTNWMVVLMFELVCVLLGR